MVWPPARTVSPEPPPEGAECAVEVDAGKVSRLRARTAELERNLEQRVEEARQLGFREGEAAGRRQAAGEVEPVLERLASALATVAELRSRVLRKAESDMVRLAMEIARRVLHRELTIDPRAIEGLVKVALDKLEAETICRVRVHPEHEGCVRACIDRLGRGSQVEIFSDPALERGGAIFETSRGSLDASLETQLKEIERGLADRLQRS